MSTKKHSKKNPKRASTKGTTFRNHVTANSQTCVARIASGLYAAAQQNAQAAGLSFAKQINRWLALGAKADGLKLTPETRAFAGV